MPKSSVAIHSSRRRKPECVVRKSPILTKNNEQRQLMDSLRENKFFTKDFNDYPNLKASHAAFYKQHVLVDFDKSLSISASTNKQCTAEWHFERSKRLKGSKAYELYTYFSNKSPNWKRKIMSCIKPSKYQSPAMKYGTEMEPEAISWYEQYRHVRVSRHGFTIHPKASFIGCSPDGVVFEENRLVEVKCPMLGKTDALTHSKIPYFYYEGGRYQLKRKHIYYGQVMVNLMILNLEICDFIVYSPFSKNGLIVEVPFDEAFTKVLLNTLTIVYFEKYLPVLADEPDDDTVVIG